MRRIVPVFLLVVLAAGVWWWRTRPPDLSRNPDLGLVSTVHGTEEARISLRALNRGGDIVTVVGEIRYDTTVLRLRECVSDGARAGKQLHFLEPEPGRVRAVLAGSLDPMPADSEVIACTFAVSNTSAGKTVVRATGEVADLNYVDRPFELTQEIALGG